MSVITHYYDIFPWLLHHYYSLLHCNNEFIFTYYDSLLHIIAYYCKFLLFLTHMCHLVLTGPRASTPELTESQDDDVPEPYANSPPERNVHERQKSTAALKLLDPGAVLARLSLPITQTTAEIIEDMRGHYVVPDGDQDPGIESGEYRTRLKRKADGISRSQYEVYSFATKHNLSEAAVDELLEMLSNVSFSFMPM